MTRIVLDMELSSAETMTTVTEALRWIDGVSVTPAPWADDRRLAVTIDTDDADQVDIVREITWQFDPAAVQHAVHVADVY